MEILMWMVWLVVGCQALSNDVTNSPSATQQVRSLHSMDNQTKGDVAPPTRDKRSSELEDILDELATKTKRDPGKMRFNSWGGKRTRIVPWTGRREGAKRKFNSWGGKRSDDSFDYLSDLSEDKRAKFNSWGGKRAKFNSWGGKRSVYEVEEDKRAKFNSWGGKRGGIDYDELPDDSSEHYWLQEDPEKRAKFNSWGGKRDDDSSATWEEEKRAKFNSWGGKRAGNNTTTDNIEDFMMVKRAYPASSLKRKQIFQSWGGKRTARSASPGFRIRSAKDRSWGTLLRPIRRGPDFYAWGGKDPCNFILIRENIFENQKEKKQKKIKTVN
uniref:Uncharacterized protein n=1 Tax=Lygus hesperus TaxID=30085 RepID=A0A0A9W6F5_LYGHE